MNSCRWKTDLSSSFLSSSMMIMMMMTTIVVIALMIVAVIVIIIITSHMLVMWLAAIIFRFTISYFIPLFIEQTKSVGVLPPGCAVLHYMIDAQLFLRPQRVFHLESGCHIYLLVRNIRAFLYLKREGLQWLINILVGSCRRDCRFTVRSAVQLPIKAVHIAN